MDVPDVPYESTDSLQHRPSMSRPAQEARWRKLTQNNITDGSTPRGEEPRQKASAHGSLVAIRPAATRDPRTSIDGTEQGTADQAEAGTAIQDVATATLSISSRAQSV